MIRSEPSLSNYSFPSGPNLSEPTTTPQHPRYPDSTQAFQSQLTHRPLVGFIKGSVKGVSLNEAQSILGTDLCVY